MMPGAGHSDSWWRQYHRMRERGYTKKQAAQVTNANRKRTKKRKRRKRD